MATNVLHLDGKTYRVSPAGMVEVYIPMGEPRVMQRHPRSAYWRLLNFDGKTAQRIRMRAAYLTRDVPPNLMEKINDHQA
jgi:hypothetical protein